MTQFEQQGQIIWGQQQNAGRDIITIHQSAAWKPLEMLPPRAQPFVGREQDLAWLREQLAGHASKTLAVCGPGGMGKTALVAEALTRLLTQPDWDTRFPGGLFYYSFYPNPSLAVAFEELARSFGEDPGSDPYRAAQRALSRRRAVLVFDGVEVLTDSLPLWEMGGRHIVILLSRRQSDAPNPAHSRTLGALSVEQGISLLQAVAGSRAADRSCVEQLVRQVGGYPLALQLIGSYLRSREEEVADYLHWFEEEGLQVLHQGEHRRQSVRILLQRTFDSLTPSEQEVCCVLGLLAPAPFPFELVQDILLLPERTVRQVLGSLVNLSVLRRPRQDYIVSHALVHTFLAKRLSPSSPTASFPAAQTIAAWRERLLDRLEVHFEHNNPYDRISLALWLPHVRPLLPLPDEGVQHLLRAARLFNAAGFAAFTQGNYAEAEPLYQQALSARERQLGALHPDTATCLNNLAALYYAQGKYAEAEPLYQQALSICEQQLGALHPHTAQSLNNLAELYRSQGKYAEAEPLLLQALSARELELGALHPDTAQSLNSLAALYYAQGKYAEAEPLYQQALSICEQQLGTMHPHTASSLHNLAALYYTQGKFAQAEPLLQRALRIAKQTLGEQHQRTQLFQANYRALLDAMRGEQETSS